MDKYNELSLALYIFLVNNSQNATKLEIQDITKCLFLNHNIDSDNLVKEIKKRIEENKIDIEEIKDDLYLKCKDDNIKLIKIYNNLNNLNNLYELLDNINKCLKTNNNHDYFITGYAFLISAVIYDSNDVEEVSQSIIRSYKKVYIAENTIETIRTININLPIKSIDKPAIWLSGSIYDSQSDKPPCYLILYLKKYEDDTVQYIYDAIPDIFMFRFEIDYIYKKLEKLKEKIKEVTANYTSNIEKLENARRSDESHKRGDFTKQYMDIMEEELKTLSEYYTKHNEITKEMFQLTYAAIVNFNNIKRTLSLYSLPKELLFGDCFYEAEKNVEGLNFYSNFYYRETDKIAKNIRDIEIESNILRSKLESIENKQNELRNVILATAGIIISFLQIFGNEVKLAILYALNILSNQIRDILNNL